MKEEPTRDGGLKWMSWVIGSSKNVQRTDDSIPGVKLKTLFDIYFKVKI